MGVTSSGCAFWGLESGRESEAGRPTGVTAPPPQGVRAGTGATVRTTTTTYTSYTRGPLSKIPRSAAAEDRDPPRAAGPPVTRGRAHRQPSPMASSPSRRTQCSPARTTPRPGSWTGRVAAVEFLHQGWIQHISRRHPTALFWSKAFPVDQVLEGPTSPSGVQQPANSINRGPIDSGCRRRVIGQRLV